MGQHLGVREQAERRTRQNLQGAHRRRSGGFAAIVGKPWGARLLSPRPAKRGEGAEDRRSEAGERRKLGAKTLSRLALRACHPLPLRGKGERKSERSRHRMSSS